MKPPRLVSLSGGVAGALLLAVLGMAPAGAQVLAAAGILQDDGATTAEGTTAEVMSCRGASSTALRRPASIGMWASGGTDRGAWLQTAALVQDAGPAAPQLHWSTGQAAALARAIERIGAEGLNPADYDPAALRAEIAAGAGPKLDALASRLLGWLVEDLRDGRAPPAARRQWFVTDPDAERMPTAQVIARALVSRDIAGTLAMLHPAHPDYAALRAELAATPAEAVERRRLIQVNMDRWRWLPRDLGGQYLLANVPEFQLRLMVNGTIIRTYRTIVGAPRTATPQLAEMVTGVIFNPTWTVPQSIVVGQGLGQRVLNNPNWARTQGYRATRNANGTITVVQAPGPNNALGAMKLDMPNRHAIFFHDTPAKDLFESEERARSHGCIRVEGALELAMTVAMLGDGASRDEAVAIHESGRYTSVPIKQPIPAFITYFTIGRDSDGNLREFADIYQRDAPVVAALEAPRPGR